MKKILIVVTALVLAATNVIAEDGALGLWKSEPGETGGYIHVEITNCDEKLCGKSPRQPLSLSVCCSCGNSEN